MGQIKGVLFSRLVVENYLDWAKLEDHRAVKVEGVVTVYLHGN